MPGVNKMAKQITATVVEPFMVAGELANVGDLVVLNATDAENLKYRGKIILPEDEGDEEEAE